MRSTIAALSMQCFEDCEPERPSVTCIPTTGSAHQRFIRITEGIKADCKEAVHIIEGVSAQTPLADRGHDTNGILAYAVSVGMEVVIPQKRTAKNNANTTNISIHCAIWFRSVF